MVTTINVQDESLRCIEFTPQQLSYWLPAGEWTVIGEETIQVSDLGIMRESKCYRLENEKHTCFVGVIVLDKLYPNK